MTTTAIEGRNAVIEALRAGVPLKRIMIAEGTKPDRSLDEIARRAGEAGIALDRVPKRALDAASERGAHQGVIAEAKPYAYARLDDVLARARGKKNSLIIALDHVTDPGNLGAIVRTAEVVGADGVLVANRRAAAVTAAAYKASAGALSHVLLAQEANLVRSLERCKSDASYWVAGASEHGSQVAWDAALEGRIVLVMGSEGDGLARLTKETCDFLVRLPQAGKVGSLNVAQAATALSYEWLRRCSLAGE
ncbi:MAG: 23S rRNA (guanosine(2251)-2'-O)-methyltransferase RlmB [Coriobacteriia bacterium]|nr:23S rRNA (guanosine(2251)-2'-O)-methyltransferase RlmB [Coriobacteriia bacterium]